MSSQTHIHIEPFFDPDTFTMTYVVSDTRSRDAVVIDPVMDYDPASSKISYENAKKVIRYLRERELKLHYILETHAHADHLSASQALKHAHPDAKVVIGERIRDVQAVFKGVFGLPDDFPTDGRQFDVLLGDGSRLIAGTLAIDVIATPGHTPACVTYRVGDHIFTGDALFMPDVGAGRCDFPGGSPADLYTSIHDRLYALPDDTKVWVGHDYPPPNRELAFMTTIGVQKDENVAIKASTTRDAFIAWRTERDKRLSAPRLLFQSVQVNVDAGALPPEHSNEVRYLKIPLNAFKPAAPDELDLVLAPASGA